MSSGSRDHYNKSFWPLRRPYQNALKTCESKGGLSSNSNGQILTKLSENPLYIPYNNRTERFLQENLHARDIDLDQSVTKFFRSGAHVSDLLRNPFVNRCWAMGGRQKTSFLSRKGGLSSNSNGPILIKLSEKPIYIPYNNRTEGFLQENSHVRDIDLEPCF